MYYRGYVFSKKMDQRGYLCKFSALRPNFSLLSNMLDFKICVNLRKRFQRIMFSFSCTTKGMIFRILVLERYGFWLKMHTIEGKGFAALS